MRRARGSRFDRRAAAAAEPTFRGKTNDLVRAADFWQPQPTTHEGKPGRLPANRSAIADLVWATLPHLSKPPPAPIVTPVRPTPLVANCSGAAWSGRRATPAVLVDVFMFAWQLDLLEVRLHELDGVVDRFVIWEGMFAQRGIEKPLVLSANLHRFRRFRDRITYIVQDDLDFQEMLIGQRESGKLGKSWEAALARGGLKRRATAGQDWVNEDNRKPAARRWLATRAAAAAGAKVAGGGGTRVAPRQPQTLFVFSDLDEIPSGEALYQLKHCVPNPQAFTAGSAARRAAAARGVPPLRIGMQAAFLFDVEHTVPAGIDVPSQVHVLSDIDTQGPRYARYPIAPRALGLGTHMSRCVRPAEYMLKSWLQAEASEWRTAAATPIALDVRRWYERQRAKRLTKNRARRVRPADGLRVPWFLEHNKARFPYLFPSLFPDALDYYS